MQDFLDDFPDVGITNANHGTICELLLAEKPVLMVPLTSEQYFMCKPRHD